MDPRPVPAARLVAVARSAAEDYGPRRLGGTETSSFQAVTSVFAALGLDAAHRGSPDWNPLGDLVAAGSRIVIKPNWVLHQNDSGAGIDCLITNTAVLDAILYYVARTHPARVVLGDAPLQRCDFAKLRADAGIDALVDHYRRLGLALELADFRSRVSIVDDSGARLLGRPERDSRSVEVDLGRWSFLEPISNPQSKFRVTCYDPRHMAAAHRPGVHRYAIARELLDADLVLNVPKLKCHLKAGVTGAIKNLVGINVDKSYLPHHRKGGSALGGDCYPGFALLRHLSEQIYDIANLLESHPSLAQWMRLPIRLYKRLGNRLGWDTRVEGAWYGNDTVWRTCLDLHRILRYCRGDGVLMQAPQRLVFSVTDAIVAGEGNGPLAPTPIPAGFMTAGSNPVAVEWVNAKLMGFDPARIPLLREALGATGEHGLVEEFDQESIEILGLPGCARLAALHPFLGRAFTPPDGWRGHVEGECH